MNFVEGRVSSDSAGLTRADALAHLCEEASGLVAVRTTPCTAKLGCATEEVAIDFQRTTAACVIFLAGCKHSPHPATETKSTNKEESGQPKRTGKGRSEDQGGRRLTQRRKVRRGSRRKRGQDIMRCAIRHCLQFDFLCEVIW